MADRDFVPAQRVTQGSLFGTGGFGVVFEGLLHEDGAEKKVALKVLPPDKDRGRGRDVFMQELKDTLETARWCKRVVQCKGWTKLGPAQSPCLIMHRYQRTLLDLILVDDQGRERAPDDPRRGLSQDRLHIQIVLRIGKDVGIGLSELHRGGVSNEDLKPGNVLLDESMHAVLSDFGLSKFISRSRVQFSTQHVRGTDYFLPPEKLNTGMPRMQYSLKADMWSFGILLGQMCSVDPLYPYGSCMTWEDIRSQLVVEKQAPMAPSTPEAPQLQRLIQQCLQLDPNQRPSADEAVQTLEAIQHSLTTPPMSPHTAALQAKEKEVEELRKKLAAVELREEAERKQRAEAEQKQRAEAERKQRAEAERKMREAEQREAQLQEQSRAADAKRQAQTAGALSKRALKLLSSPTHTATLSGHTWAVNSVAFTPDGACLVSGSRPKTVKLWDVASGRCTATLEGHSECVNSVAVSVDGRTAASGSSDGSVKLWDLGSRRCRATLNGNTHWQWTNPVCCLAFSPDGATMASGGQTGHNIRLWDASTGKHKATLKGGGMVYGLAFSADGTRLASGDERDSVWLWDVRSGNRIAKLEGHSDVVNSVVFSTDGAHVLSGSKDKTIRVWDTNTKTCKRTMKWAIWKWNGHSEGVNCVAMTPDGANAISGSEDGTIRIWDWQRGVCVAKLECSNSVYSVAVSPDGRMLAGGQSNKEIKLWTIAS